MSLELVLGMVAYDCAGKELNITSLSLIETAPCPVYKTDSIYDDLDVQILQERETYDLHIYQCLIEIDYHVTYCGMSSHSSEMKNGWGTLIQDLTSNECKRMHTDGIAQIYGKAIQGLKRNSSLTTTLTLAGTVTGDGSCTGGDLNLGPYHWSGVLGVGKVTIRLSDSEGVYRVADDTVVTKRGLSCKYSNGACMDTYEGLVTWDVKSEDKCSMTSYVVLYRGRVSKITIKSTDKNQDSYTMYSVKDGKFLATLLDKGRKNICGIGVVVTDHPKLLVQEVRNGLYFFKQDGVSAKNMDIFLYVNAKFTHIENHMRREMSTMYETLITDLCETKRSLLQTQLSIATIDPVEFAYTHKQEPGYSAIVMGEQVHIIKCRAVFVSARKTEGCFNELPINYTGQPMFMAPRSHIIQKTGTPVTCSILMQPTYKLSGTWFASQNGLSKTSEPSLLSPAIDTKWVYTDAGELATQGIYSYTDLDILRSQLMYPSERKAITQTVSAMINQDSYISDTSIFSKLLTKEAVEMSFKEFIHNTWSSFLSFGSFFSGVFGLMLIFKIVKWMFDTVVHSRGLYEVYGCSWHIIASIWDAATTYLLSPVRVSKSRKTQPSKESNNESGPSAPCIENGMYPTLPVEDFNTHLQETMYLKDPKNDYSITKPPKSYSQIMKERLNK